MIDMDLAKPVFFEYSFPMFILNHIDVLMEQLGSNWTEWTSEVDVQTRADLCRFLAQRQLASDRWHVVSI